MGRVFQFFGPRKMTLAFGSKLVNHLPARAARRARRVLIISDGDCLNFHCRSHLRHGGEDRRALGAIAHAVGGIFDVATGEKIAAGGQQRSTDLEIGIGSVSVLHSSPRRRKQALPHSVF